MIRKFLDLGLQPLANKYLTKKDYLFWQADSTQKIYDLYILYNIKTDLN